MRASNTLTINPYLLEVLFKMYFTKVQTIQTFKEIYNDDLKVLHGQKKINKKTN